MVSQVYLTRRQNEPVPESQTMSHPLHARHCYGVYVCNPQSVGVGAITDVPSGWRTASYWERKPKEGAIPCDVTSKYLIT